MPDDLIARLRAGLDEDERVALAAIADLFFSYIGDADREYFERFGPLSDFVPRWVKAVREILERHQASHSPYANGDRSCLGCGAGSDGEMLVADVNDCPVVRALASVYGDGGG